ncbi:hypothetical protein NLJ89_g5299 [Agrocybe chaxingu]|uniref:Uncharacterized protein n=1 Tax=Agrocybe chaxingu TaxID=84603 RepID=A0A9W8K0G5_9AGAR|nr:hypothetical protein NLJ89_g5299 [Agrocybe chaxingu]
MGTTTMFGRVRSEFSESPTTEDNPSKRQKVGTSTDLEPDDQEDSDGVQGPETNVGILLDLGDSDTWSLSLKLVDGLQNFGKHNAARASYTLRLRSSSLKETTLYLFRDKRIKVRWATILDVRIGSNFLTIFEGEFGRCENYGQPRGCRDATVGGRYQPILMAVDEEDQPEHVTSVCALNMRPGYELATRCSPFCKKEMGQWR